MLKFISTFAKKNDISLPDVDVMTEIVRDLRAHYGTKEFSSLEYAVRYWTTGHIPEVRKPRTLTSHFIGLLMQGFANLAASGAKGEGLEKPTRQPFQLERTQEQKHETSVNCWRRGFREMKEVFGGSARPGYFVRTLWCCANIARDYDINIPHQAKEEWVDRLKAYDLKNMSGDSWRVLIEGRRHRTVEKNEDKDLFDKAARIAEYFDTITKLPELDISKRR